MGGPLAGMAVFVCLFSSAVAGVIVHARLPGHGLSLGVRTTMHRGVAALAAIAGVLLVMQTLAQKAHFDQAGHEVQRFSAAVIELDHTLRRAGSAADPARALLFRYAMRTMQRVWPAGNVTARPEPPAGVLHDRLEAAITAIPASSAQQRAVIANARRALRRADRSDRALAAGDTAAASHWLVALVLLWLMVTFATFGLAAPAGRGRSQALVLTLLLLGAAALGAAAFLLREYQNPFYGLITVSHEPLQAALFAISE